MRTHLNTFHSAAIDWLTDCGPWPDTDAEEIAALDTTALELAIQTHYVGGVVQFETDNGLLATFSQKSTRCLKGDDVSPLG